MHISTPPATPERTAPDRTALDGAVADGAAPARTAADAEPWRAEVRRPERTAAFFSPEARWSVRGALLDVRAEEAAAAVDRYFDRRPDAAVVLAARPFADDIPAVLVGGVPETVPEAPQEHMSNVVDARAARVHPSREGFEQRVALAVRAIRTAETSSMSDGRALEKVVLGRRVLLPLAPGATAADAAGRLLRGLGGGRARLGYTFSIPLLHGGALVGHSPELLLRRSGTAVESCPLAGSAPRSGDPAVDAERRRLLLDSVKDRREHRYVVDEVAARLREVCTEVHTPAAPRVFETETMLHLGTPIRAVLAAGAPGAFALAERLHPTPAVCGTPTSEAREVIAALEEPRGYFTGMVGWQDRSGDGETAIAIRCAEITPAAVEVFAGAGVISDSDPAAEADETQAKMRTVLRALGTEEVVA